MNPNKTISVNMKPTTVRDYHLVQKASVCFLKQIHCSLQLFNLDFQIKFKVQPVAWVQDTQETSPSPVANPIVNK